MHVLHVQQAVTKRSQQTREQSKPRPLTAIEFSFLRAANQDCRMKADAASLYHFCLCSRSLSCSLQPWVAERLKFVPSRTTETAPCTDRRLSSILILSMLTAFWWQHFPEAQRRLVQEGIRVERTLFRRRRSHHLWQQQEALRVLVRRHSRDSSPLPICMP